MSTKHTPGPWIVCGSQNENQLTTGSIWIETIKGDNVASIHRVKAETLREEEKEMCANARLMAASPELLEALKEAEAIIQSLCARSAINPNAIKNFNKITNAIQKAEQ